MNELFLEGRLNGDTIEITNPPRALFIFEGKDLDITIKELSLKYSDAQMRYFWGSVVNDIIHFYKDTAGETYDKYEVYDYILKVVMGMKAEIRKVLGEELLVLRFKGISSLSKKEFSELIDKITLHFGEQGCIIKEPRFSLK